MSFGITSDAGESMGSWPTIEGASEIAKDSSEEESGVEYQVIVLPSEEVVQRWKDGELIWNCEDGE